MEKKVAKEYLEDLTLYEPAGTDAYGWTFPFHTITSGKVTNIWSRTG